jgi:hypothetical protein
MSIEEAKAPFLIIEMGFFIIPGRKKRLSKPGGLIAWVLF